MANNNDRLRFLDYRPIRPTPNPLESFCSFFVRSAHVSGFTKLTHWAKKLRFGKFYNKQVSDFPRKNFGAMADLLNLSNEQLLGTTFHYIGEKFRAKNRSQLYKLMLGSLTNQLRYCPLCVAETGCYLLTWRLSMIDGCAEHRCRLRDTCPHCEAKLPLVSAKGIGICPFCGCKLSDADFEILSEKELLITRVRTADFIYLLQPHAHSYSIKIEEKLVQIRKSLGISRETIARDLQMTRDDVALLEKVSHRLSTLRRYFSLADYYGYSLREVLAYTEYDLDIRAVELQNIQRVCKIRQQEIMATAAIYEQNLLQKVRDAAPYIEDTDKSIQLLVSKAIGIGYREISLYPSVLEEIRALDGERNIRYRQTRLREIQSAISLLESQGELPSGPHISRIVGYDVHKLRDYPEIDEIVSAKVKHAAGHIKIWNDDHTSQTYQDWPTVRARVTAIVFEAENSGQYLFKRQVAKLVGAHYNTLQNDLETRLLLDAHESRRIDAWETQKLEECDRAWQFLRETHQPINVQDLGKQLGVRHEYLRRHPKLWNKVVSYVDQYKEEQEEILVSRVQQTVKDSRAQKIQITLTLIANKVEMAPTNLKRHPDVLRYLNTLAEFPSPLKAPPQPKPRKGSELSKSKV